MSHHHLQVTLRLVETNSSRDRFLRLHWPVLMACLDRLDTDFVNALDAWREEAAEHIRSIRNSFAELGQLTRNNGHTDLYRAERDCCRAERLRPFMPALLLKQSEAVLHFEDQYARLHAEVDWQKLRILSCGQRSIRSILYERSETAWQALAKGDASQAKHLMEEELTDAQQMEANFGWIAFYSERSREELRQLLAEASHRLSAHASCGLAKAKQALEDAFAEAKIRLPERRVFVLNRLG